MTKRDKIIRYLELNGIDIREYIQDGYEQSGTIVIRSCWMEGKPIWSRLLDTIHTWGSPVEMHRIKNPDFPWRSGDKYLWGSDRLTWNNKW